MEMLKDFFNINDKVKEKRMKHILIFFIVIVLLYLLYAFFIKDNNSVAASAGMTGGSTIDNGSESYPTNVLLDKADFILGEISQSYP